MQPFSQCPLSILQNIRAVLTDIDDTITSHGLLPSGSIRAMEKLSDAGILVIPVTGRPAGWCDHIARMWPVDAVVGENGALYFSYDRKLKQMNKCFAKSEAEREGDRAKLNKLAKEILNQVPGAGLASDQDYRVADLAIDFCEDVPPLSSEEIDKIQEILQSGGATTKVSSIHVNAWFGSYDKMTMSRQCLKDLFSMDIESENDKILFTGDSPNDSPMFAYFNNSVGVSNIMNFSLPPDHEPAYVTDQPDSLGFASVAEAILNARNKLN